MKNFKWILSSWLILFFLLTQSVTILAQDDSDQRKKKSDDSEKKGKLGQFKHEDEKDDGENDDEEGSFWTEFLFDFGWELSKFLLFSTSFDSTRFCIYPYAGGEYGLAVLQGAPLYRTGFGQVQLSYHYVDHNLYGIIFSLRGRLNTIAGLSLDISQYREDLMNEPDDSMTLIRLGLMKSLLIRAFLIWDLDLGIRTLDSDAGFDGGMRFQIFPKPPFCLDLWLSAGSINHTFFGEFKPMAGIMTGRFQWDLGFRYLQWGDEELHGAIAGIRIWF